MDDDCDGVPGAPFCGGDGACVACKTSAQCTDASAPVCDDTSHACRSCVNDGECPGGICLEAEGTCAVDENVRFITQGGSDSGECTKSTPCGSIGFAAGLSPLGGRRIVHIIGDLNVTATTITQPVYLDGVASKITGGGATALLTVSGAGDLTVSGVDIEQSGGSGSSFHVTAGTLTLVDSKVVGTGGDVVVDAGTANIRTTTFDEKAVISCQNGATLSITRSSVVNQAEMQINNCIVTLTRNTLGLSPGRVYSQNGGTATVTNNVFVETNQFTDAALAIGLTTDSIITFNTFVNLSGIDNMGVALTCDGTPLVANNIFAYGSSNPIDHTPTTPCRQRNNLFDGPGSTDAAAMDLAGDGTTFFVDSAGMDFHLAAGSPAIGAGAPDVKTDVDFDGTPRPTSRPPDIGAFTAP